MSKDSSSAHKGLMTNWRHHSMALLRGRVGILKPGTLRVKKFVVNRQSKEMTKKIEHACDMNFRTLKTMCIRR
jgi:peptidyl-tRNA hydrolase